MCALLQHQFSGGYAFDLMAKTNGAKYIGSHYEAITTWYTRDIIRTWHSCHVEMLLWLTLEIGLISDVSMQYTTWMKVIHVFICKKKYENGILNED